MKPSPLQLHKIICFSSHSPHRMITETLYFFKIPIKENEKLLTPRQSRRHTITIGQSTETGCKTTIFYFKFLSI